MADKQQGVNFVNVNYNWSRAKHATFGVEFNRRVGALMLGLRRLEEIGAAPPMDPAVLEEMLEYYIEIHVFSNLYWMQKMGVVPRLYYPE